MELNDILNNLSQLPAIRKAGAYSEYKPETTHKDVIYFATDVNKIYLNGSEYGGSDIPEYEDTDEGRQKLFEDLPYMAIINSNSEGYGYHKEVYIHGSYYPGNKHDSYVNIRGIYATDYSDATSANDYSYITITFIIKRYNNITKKTIIISSKTNLSQFTNDLNVNEYPKYYQSQGLSKLNKDIFADCYPIITIERVIDTYPKNFTYSYYKVGNEEYYININKFDNDKKTICIDYIKKGSNNFEIFTTIGTDDINDILEDKNYQTAEQVDNRFQQLIGAAPADLDTLEEIAEKLQDGDDIHTALVQSISEKATKEELNNYLTKADIIKQEIISIDDYNSKKENNQLDENTLYFCYASSEE